MIDIPGESGWVACTVDILPFTVKQGMELVESIASAEQMRELRASGNTQFVYLYSDGRLGTARIRVAAQILQESLTLELQNLGRVQG